MFDLVVALTAFEDQATYFAEGSRGASSAPLNVNLRTGAGHSTATLMGFNKLGCGRDAEPIFSNYYYYFFGLSEWVNLARLRCARVTATVSHR